jgi:acetyl-CoA acetyltransferase
MNCPAPDRELRNAAAVVGVGDTDYAFDYITARQRDSEPKHDIEARLAVTAFERALADAGLGRKDIDGLAVAFGAPEPAALAEVADTLGVRPRHLTKVSPITAGVIPLMVQALASGVCDTLAIIYSAPMRSVRRVFGGDGSPSGPTTYYYYHPWGWSSQAAHWALMYQHYQAKYGTSEADLGVVAIGLRENARLNENAIMRDPMTIDDYLSSRYIVRPMHLFDMCLVNDGAVCVILRRSDIADGLRQVPIYVSGWGTSHIPDDKFRHMVFELMQSQYQEAGRQALDMAGVSVEDIDHFQGYDASTNLLIHQIEGYRFVPPGEALSHWADGYMSLAGRLPVNTSGGQLSESYMQGWGHIVEAVRQLRGVCGARQQSRDASVAMVALSTTDEAFPVIYSRGDG